ncbi:MAG: flagellar basal body rod protein FlgB [Oscillospiraceae bacterium]
MLFTNMEYKAMESSLDSLWLKQQVITNNLANSDTPGFKSKTVSFENVLADRMGDKKSNREYDYRSKIVTDNGTEARPDGNNVDVEKESAELWRAYAQYSYLTGKISGSFKNMNYVLNQAFK